MLEGNDLKLYLQDLITLTVKVRKYDKAIDSMVYEIKNMDTSVHPVKKRAYEPVESKVYQEFRESFRTSQIITVAEIVIIIAIALFFADPFQEFIVGSLDYFLDAGIFMKLLLGVTALPMIVIGVFGAVIVGPWTLVEGFFTASQKEKEYEEHQKKAKEQNTLIDRRYERECQEAQANAKLRQKKKSTLTAEVEKMLEIRNEYSKAVKALLDMQIVHRNYRSLLDLMMIWNYLDEGRTKSLGISGADPGAYSMLREDQFRKELLDTQYEILSEIRGMNRRMADIANRLDRIENGIEKAAEVSINNSRILQTQQEKLLENTQLTALHTQQLKDMAEEWTRIELYRKRMNGEIPANTIFKSYSKSLW